MPPCNDNTFCAVKGLVANAISVDSNPPQQADNACSEMYCIDPNLIPYPSFVSANPSSGIISGGTIVTVRAQGSAATHLSNVEIQVGFDVGNPISLLQVRNAFDESILIFAMPTSPQGAITQDVEVEIRVGAVRRSVRFLFQYIRPLVGNPVVSKIVPSSVYQSQALTYLVKLTNFPKTILQKIALISIEYLNSRKTVERIVESSADTTVAAFILPANALNVGRHSLRIFYTSHISIDRAGSVVIDVLSDPSPRIQGLSSSEGQSSSEAKIVELRAEYFLSGLPCSSFTITLTSAGGLTRALILDSMAYSDTNCNFVACSVVALRFALPANPDGLTAQGIAEIKLCVGSVCVTTAYHYITGCMVQLIEPSGAVLNQQKFAKIYLSNFDVPFESNQEKSRY